MRTIIAGSREVTDYRIVYKAIIESDMLYQITEVVCGGATGVDLAGDRFAAEMRLPVEYFLVTNDGYFDFSKLRNLRPRMELLGTPRYARDYANVQYIADWAHGRSAAAQRNQAMARYAGALIAVHKSASRGTQMMIDFARQHRLHTFVREVA